MVFKSDKQRKAVMAKLNQGSTRSDVKPTFIQRTKGRLRRKFRPTEQEVEEDRLKRIRKEQQALESEGRVLKQLEAEAKIEQARESVAKRRRETQAEFTRIERERFARSKRGRAVAFARKGVAVGIKKFRESAKQPKQPTRKKRKAPPKEDVSPFGI